jgi:hypothetical protein
MSKAEKDFAANEAGQPEKFDSRNASISHDNFNGK